MQSNNKILELAKKLPFGAKKEVAERTGLCITTVCNILKGNKCRLNNLKKVTRVAKEILKECDNAVKV